MPTIEIKCDSPTSLSWRETTTSSWALLGATSATAPTISVTSTSPVTFVFVQAGASANSVSYKDDPGSTPVTLPTSGGPSVVVSTGDDNLVYFAQANQRVPGWYCGYVKVSSS